MAVVLGALVAGLVSCGGDDFEDRTARVTIDGRTSTFQVDSCGLDQQTVFVVGRTDGGATLQVVVGVTFPDAATNDGLPADEAAVPDEKAVPAATGITVDVGGTVWEAFGAEAWTRRGKTGPAPGTITSARVRGARIQADGELVELDADQLPVVQAVPVSFTLDARCDETNR